MQRTDVGEAKITIIMPNYNMVDFIRKSLSSALDQTWRDVNILIVDNASTDGSLDVIEGLLEDPRVRVVRNERNIGAVENFRKALDLVRSEYVKWLCTDDYLHPKCVEEQMGLLEKYPSVGLVSGQFVGVDKSGRELPVGAPRDSQGPVPGRRAIEAFMRTATNFIGGNVMFRMGKYRPLSFGESLGRHYSSATDTVTILDVLQRSDWYCSSTRSYYVRTHEGSYSVQAESSALWAIEHSILIRDYLANGWYFNSSMDRKESALNNLRWIGQQMMRTEVMARRPDLAKQLVDEADFWIQGIEGGHLLADYRVRNLMARARCLEQKGQLQRAIASCEQALQLDPAHPEANLQVGRLCLLAGRYDLALARLKLVVEVDEANYIAHGILGLALQANGDLESALRHLELAVSKGQRGGPVVRGLADTYLGLGKCEEALSIYKSLIETPEGNVGDVVRMAEAFEMMGKPDLAKECKEIALELDASLAEGPMGVKSLATGATAIV